MRGSRDQNVRKIEENLTHLTVVHTPLLRWGRHFLSKNRSSFSHLKGNFLNFPKLTKLISSPFQKESYGHLKKYHTFFGTSCISWVFMCWGWAQAWHLVQLTIISFRWGEETCNKLEKDYYQCWQDIKNNFNLE